MSERPQEERMRILRMVVRGEIKPAEGQRRIDAASGNLPHAPGDHKPGAGGGNVTATAAKGLLGAVFGLLVAGLMLLIVGASLALAGVVILGSLAVSALSAPFVSTSSLRKRRKGSGVPPGSAPELDEEGQPIKFVESHEKRSEPDRRPADGDG